MTDLYDVLTVIAAHLVKIDVVSLACINRRSASLLRLTLFRRRRSERCAKEYGMLWRCRTANRLFRHKVLAATSEVKASRRVTDVPGSHHDNVHKHHHQNICAYHANLSGFESRHRETHKTNRDDSDVDRLSQHICWIMFRLLLYACNVARHTISRRYESSI